MAFGVFMMTLTNLVLTVGPMYVIFNSGSQVMFLEQFIPHAVIGKIAWHIEIPWVRRQMARLVPGGRVVAPAFDDASDSAV